MKLKNVYCSTAYMVFEFLLFFIFVPFITAEFLEGWWKVIPLLLIALFFTLLLLNDSEFDKRNFIRFDASYFIKSIPRITIISVLVVWFTFWIFPQLFFQYPLEHLPAYVLTFFLYPIVSVLPQEIIYRMYFFHRYQSIVPERYLLMLSNAVIFGLTHLIYDNLVAPIATFLVSWIFIFNYLKTKSLLNVSLEHYIYGLVMFTAGFGYFFA